MKSYNKLDQLTALRSFAALMIVIHHLDGLFGIKNIGINWGQGVSFFFVLSGFILTYVYPNLETSPEIRRFWRARIARVWPAYFGSLVLGFVLIPYAWETKTAVANLFMVQAWVPVSSYYFSYNSVSWSISTEAFFYLAFPALLYKWNKFWKIKFIIAGVALIALLYTTNHLQLPDYGSPNIETDSLLVTQHGLIYINPISRIFEFVLGMVVATLWLNNKNSKESRWATFNEVASVAICAASLYFSNDIAQLAGRLSLGSAAVLWVVHSGSLFSFGLLIYVLAKGAGLISKIISAPIPVLLGEVSFSMYLIHQILLIVYIRNLSSFSHIPNGISLIAFFVILLTSSYLMWVCIEMPGRRLLLGRGKIHGTSMMKESWHNHVPLGKNTAIACFLLLVFIGAFQFIKENSLAPVSCCDGVSKIPLGEGSRFLYSLKSSQTLGDQTGNVALQQQSIHIHPGTNNSTSVTFDLGGKFNSFRLRPFIEKLDDEGKMHPEAGIVGFEVFIDGKSTGRFIVDRTTALEKTLDVHDAKFMELRVDNGNSTSAWDWFMVEVTSIK